MPIIVLYILHMVKFLRIGLRITYVVTNIKQLEIGIDLTD